MHANALLDSIPRTRVRVLGRATPAFRACGVAGFYAAVVLVLVLGPLAGRSLFALLGASSACGLSFYAYAYLRKRLTGREKLVLLEHVWVALAACVGLFGALGVPVLAHLDVVVVAMAFFLACGRVGCLMVGCCHGHPSELGVCYGDDAVRDGFAAHLSGVRLFPVQLLESVGLALLGVAMIPILFVTPEGACTSTFLGGYAVMRFGLEGLRGDPRPHLLGLSQSRWMALAELVAVLGLAAYQAGVRPLPREMLGGGLVASFGLGALMLRFGVAAWRQRALFSPRHVAELRETLRALTATAGKEPLARVSSLGVQLAVSEVSSSDRGQGGGASEPPKRAALSLCAPDRGIEPDVVLRLAAVLGYPAPDSARLLPGGVLVFLSDTLAEEAAPEPSPMPAAPRRSSYFASRDTAEGRA
jgi:hypothetical protein